MLSLLWENGGNSIPIFNSVFSEGTGNSELEKVNENKALF